MPRLKIDNLEIDVPSGATILDAARAAGIDIPTLCHRDGCTPETSCLVCLVKLQGAQRLIPSCATRAVDGMIVESETPEVHAARRTALELLLADHAGDCLAPCQNVCPAHMNIPLMIRQISAGQLRQAIITVKEKIALPAVLGRICPELCEHGCRRAQKDAAVSICALKRQVADTDLASGAPYLPACAPGTGRRVAIVGTGPAGLAAAYYLQQRGHACTLFDDHAEPGGNLRYAVGAERLPHSVLDAEIDVIRALGAQFRLHVCIGRDLSLSELRSQHDAVLLAAGELDAPKAQALGLPLAGKGLAIDKQTLMTSIPGVFAAGGSVLPLRHAVRAVAAGRDAASVIDQYLRAQTPAVHGPAFTSRLGALSDPEQAEFFAIAIERARALPAAGASAGLAADEARLEAERCMHCDCTKLHGCRLRQEAVRYHADPNRFKGQRRQFQRVTAHEQIIYEPGKCIACGLCVQITQRAQEPLGLTWIGRGFDLRIGVPFNETMSQALREVARECAQACPTGALVLAEAAQLSPGRRVSLRVLD